MVVSLATRPRIVALSSEDARLRGLPASDDAIVLAREEDVRNLKLLMPCGSCLHEPVCDTLKRDIEKNAARMVVPQPEDTRFQWLVQIAPSCAEYFDVNDAVRQPPERLSRFNYIFALLGNLGLICMVGFAVLYTLWRLGAFRMAIQ